MEEMWKIYIKSMWGNMDMRLRWFYAQPDQIKEDQEGIVFIPTFDVEPYARRIIETAQNRVWEIIFEKIWFFLERDISASVIERLLKSLQELTFEDKVLITAPTGRLLDLAKECEGGKPKIILTWVSNLRRSSDNKKIHILESLKRLVDPLEADRISIYRKWNKWTIDKWKVKYNGEEGNPFDIEYVG